MSDLSVYLQFAENLRTMCLQKGTIAKVCKEIGINRQQFNKYLAGGSLPNQDTMARIAGYFTVDPIVLFQPPQTPMPTKKRRDARGALVAYRETLDHLGFTPDQYMDVPLAEGCYFIYYPWLFDATLVVRAVVVAFKRDGMTFFRRFTRIKSLERLKQRHYARGHHEGIVLSAGRNLCLLAKSNSSVGEVSLQTYQTDMFAAEGAMTGISMVMTPWGDYGSIRCTMTYFGPKDQFRAALKLAKIGTLTKDMMSEFVWVSVTQPLQSRVPQLQAFDFDDWLKKQDDMLP